MPKLYKALKKKKVRNNYLDSAKILKSVGYQSKF